MDYMGSSNLGPASGCDSESLDRSPWTSKVQFIMYISTYAYICIHIYKCIYIYVYTCMCIHLYMYICIHMHILCMYMCKYIYIHMYDTSS